MSKKTLILSVMFSSLLGGIFALLGYRAFFDVHPMPIAENRHNVKFSKYLEDISSTYTVPEGVNFILAAEKVTPAVVHIKTYYGNATASNGDHGKDLDNMLDWFRDRYEEDEGMSPNRLSSGSGVIISENGYIITNNHVIEDAERVEVVLDDRRSYEGKVIGRDLTTDLALIKIEAKSLVFVKFGNSDHVKVGEWVLAVGNPFDLTSTVTAGIVSAKARSINILKDRDNRSVESFIQTDAAVNPGNSGGALVNLKGELIGINTAIATSTGTYAGYSFAVPVSLVQKVAEDLLKYGEVQRALLGVSIQDVTSQLAHDQGLKTVRGVYVSGINNGSAADEAGMEIGDVITHIDNMNVNSVSALQELVARRRPGDKVLITYERAGLEKKVSVVLKNKNNDTGVIKTKSQSVSISELGAEIVPLSDEEKADLGIESGLKIAKLREGKLKSAKVKEGFIITHIDKAEINSVNDLRLALRNKSGGVLIEGIEPNGEKAFYGIGF